MLTAWNWKEGAFEWITPSQNVPTLQHQESIWAGQLRMMEAGGAAAGEGEEEGGETPTMTAMRDMKSTTPGTVAGALHRRTTVDSGLAHDPTHTVQDDTKLLPSIFPVLPITDCV